MFSVTAKEARELKRKGLDQDEMLDQAASRCQLAVVDQSKKGKSSVEVAVFDLTDKSFERLQNYIQKHEFKVSSAYRHNDRTHSITIDWGDTKL